MSLMWIPKQNQELQAKLSHLVRMLNIGGDVAGGGEKKTREAEIANFAVSLDGVGFWILYLSQKHKVFNQELGSTYTIECWYQPTKSDGKLMALNKEDEWEFANKGGLFQSAIAR